MIDYLDFRDFVKAVETYVHPLVVASHKVVVLIVQHHSIRAYARARSVVQLLVRADFIVVEFYLFALTYRLVYLRYIEKHRLVFGFVPIVERLHVSHVGFEVASAHSYEFVNKLLGMSRTYMRRAKHAVYEHVQFGFFNRSIHEIRTLAA